ncbi:5-formyltetrahydrofolate cyclo-ligase [Paenibacillus sp. sptzw28]|uniref:5-formyltetrahydrofolate cyclo-ligase n=1 Tax=Paenibacillus sp. sptzw28 TaxID=715179 RepID=UPI001C6EBC2B|nr:5-formyltetrahydrofolate cyclo-ligase [Paenibacillus sp. sptzw28]QYR20845.1 5-formyltetrahydrofolate cyclo-ligase [Paenibacillus sp. sptzw28]
MAQSGEPTELSARKKEARSAAAAARDSLPEELRAAWSIEACKAAIQWMEHKAPGTVQSFMTYAPFRSELDTSLLARWGWQTGTTVIVPRCIREDRSMELYVIRGWEELSPGAYGIMEPDATRAQRCGDLLIPDVVFVPGLAFDTNGGRLGYGGGYYDRFRDRLCAVAAGTMVPPWIGIGYESQWMDNVPMESHDARVDAVVTELGVRSTKADNSRSSKEGANNGFDAF